MKCQLSQLLFLLYGISIGNVFCDLHSDIIDQCVTANIKFEHTQLYTWIYQANLFEIHCDKSTIIQQVCFTNYI